ncbi:MAG: hypothetical protein U0Q18_30800 [Bryobacteraceae bacterium]
MPHNPIGFGAADFVELTLAALLLLLAFTWKPLLEAGALRLAKKAVWCMVIAALLPVALRLLLLPRDGVPTPEIYDEFGHLLVADTLRHFRLANPPQAMPQFFETFFVLQEPTYSSIYPIGQGLMLAAGWTLFGIPWAGVLISTAAFCGLCYWMLRGWTTPGWSLAGAVLAMIEFGPLNQWMNSYWGGSLAAAAGCLVWGSLPRLRESRLTRYAVLVGIGFAIHLLTRPYESIFLLIGILLFFSWRDARVLMRPALIAALLVAPAIGITLLQNKRVTGNWTTLPYSLSQYQYGVPAALTFQPNPTPHRPLTREQSLDYKMQLSFRGEAPETIGSYVRRLGYRVRYYRFFFLAPLYLVLPFFVLRMRERRYFWAALCLLIFALGINFFPAFQYHYLASVTCLFVLVSVAGLERLSQWNETAAQVVFLLCAAQFVWIYGARFVSEPDEPGRRAFIFRELAKQPGKQLVFVRYWPRHIFQDEWVYNGADIDGAKVIWARDLGPEEDRKLIQSYPERAVWLLEPDARPPKLRVYDSAN